MDGMDDSMERVPSNLVIMYANKSQMFQTKLYVAALFMRPRLNDAKWMNVEYYGIH